MPMTCIPPIPRKPFPFGDLVPLGFLVRALHHATQHPAANALIQDLTALLTAKQHEHLWAFHSGHLITSTDSCLILLGLHDVQAITALDRFYDGQYGYYPQLWSLAPRPDHMLLKPSYRHWCQTDYATTCFIRGLQRQAHVPVKTPLEYISAGFDHRSGLFFANPYLVDWGVALAIKDDPDVHALRTQLLLEVLASQQPDGSFGRFDRLLSTALAVLTLTTLGHGGNALNRAQEWIAEAADTPLAEEKARPFYSSDLLDERLLSFHQLVLFKALNGDQVCQIEKTYHGISYYEDSEHMIRSALLFLALAEASSEQGDMSQEGEERSVTQACHPRYQCRSQAEYLSRYALPPYVRGLCET
ncbi:hypothetical protein GF339_23855 [candidate division KSB3 bacterium]|uniref:Uncharacterized protein n=1 Tax=candidate division KSB3 bacterium TaxID=2044937 RepID=A0A9D5K0B2_9BACT|nr:hypothetical protein [candidate division KSB3 bacterium]MBD3327639.1 hypothetical protein [candidate division KSB3 bacterium]